MSLEHAPQRAAGSFQHLTDILGRDPDYLDRLITEQEAAEFLGVQVKTLQEWRTKGRGPRFVRLGTRMVKYRRRELISFSDDRLVSSTAEASKAA